MGKKPAPKKIPKMKPKKVKKPKKVQKGFKPQKMGYRPSDYKPGSGSNGFNAQIKQATKKTNTKAKTRAGEKARKAVNKGKKSVGKSAGVIDKAMKQVAAAKAKVVASGAKVPKILPGQEYENKF